MGVDAKIVKELRSKTGAGMMDCKQALVKSSGNLDKAIDFLRKSGIAKAEKKISRVAKEGMVYSYIHQGSRLGVLLEIGCETDFVAKLIDVYPDGTAINVAEGLLRTRYRKSLDQPKKLNPGEIYELMIDLVDTSNLFLKGHRIRLDVTSSHFPQFNRNLNTGEAFGLHQKPQVANQTIYHSNTYPSHFILPVIPSD